MTAPRSARPSDLLTRIHPFLERHGLAPEERPPAWDGLADLAAGDPGDSALLEILADQVADAVGRSPELLAGAPAGTVALTALAVFLDGEPELRAMVCRRLADAASAAPLVLVYLELAEDLALEGLRGEESFVRLDRLLRTWRSRWEKLRDRLGAEALDRELEAIRRRLTEGRWIERLSEVVEGTLLHSLGAWSDVARLRTLLDDRPSLRRGLEGAFRKLRPETIERFLEARRMTAYLITFKSTGGTVFPLLESLDRSKYTFKRYTKNARVGVFRRELTFQDFSVMFQEDFDRIVRDRRRLVPAWAWSRKDLKKMEVIVHRFGLSGRNYYEYRGPFVARDAIRTLQTLFSEVLEPDDLVSLLLYEGRDVVGMILREPISVLVADRIELTAPEQKALATGERDLRLRNALLEKCGEPDPETLAGRFRKAAGDQREALLETAAGVFADELGASMGEIRTRRGWELAQALLDAVAATGAAGVSELPLVRLLESRLELFAEERTALERDPDRLRAKLLEALRCKGPDELVRLAERSRNDDNARAKSLEVIRRVLLAALPKKIRGLWLRRGREIGEAYLGTLVEVAGVRSSAGATKGAKKVAKPRRKRQPAGV